jgi:hypothetical protein
MADKVVFCSFCRRSSDEVGKMLEGDKLPGTNRKVCICLQCAAEAVEILSSANPKPESKE